MSSYAAEIQQVKYIQIECYKESIRQNSATISRSGSKGELHPTGGNIMATCLLIFLAYFAVAPAQVLKSIDRLTNDKAPALQFVAGSDGADSAQGRAHSGQEDCGWIGVQVSPMTRPFADSLGMTELYGAIFERPQPGSPAAQAKIEAGDVLTSINGEPLKSWSDFGPTISGMAPGTNVYLNTYRDGQLIERTVTLSNFSCSRQP